MCKACGKDIKLSKSECNLTKYSGEATSVPLIMQTIIFSHGKLTIIKAFKAIPFSSSSTIYFLYN